MVGSLARVRQWSREGAQTDRQTQLHWKAGRTSLILQKRKKCLYALGELMLTERKTALCSAVLALSGTAWAPAVGHTVEIRWVPRSTSP